MTKTLLKLRKLDPEDGFSYPSRSHIRSRKINKSEKKVFFKKSHILKLFSLLITLSMLRKGKFWVFWKFLEKISKNEIQWLDVPDHKIDLEIHT